MSMICPSEKSIDVMYSLKFKGCHLLSFHRKQRNYYYHDISLITFFCFNLLSQSFLPHAHNILDSDFLLLVDKTDLKSTFLAVKTRLNQHFLLRTFLKFQQSPQATAAGYVLLVPCCKRPLRRYIMRPGSRIKSRGSKVEGWRDGEFVKHGHCLVSKFHGHRY